MERDSREGGNGIARRAHRVLATCSWCGREAGAQRTDGREARAAPPLGSGGRLPLQE